MVTEKREVRWERMFPDELEAAFAACPAVYFTYTILLAGSRLKTTLFSQTMNSLRGSVGEERLWGNSHADDTQKTRTQSKEKNRKMNPELFTIGYEGVTQADLLYTLHTHDIQALLDIRQLPLSRRPGFSKTALGLAASQQGIAYTHLRALGTPRDIRYRYRIDKDAAAFREGFLAYLTTQNEAMEDLMIRVQHERCCLLCYEAEVRHCHRLFVSERLVEKSGGAIQVTHLSVAGGAAELLNREAGKADEER